MPITSSVPIKVFSQDEYHVIDKVAKGHAFNIHNEFGRFLDEKLYQNELANRLRKDGYQIEQEVKITVSLDDFSCDYYIDLLMNNGVLFEIKTSQALTQSHRAQVLNYLYICGIQHGTLVNFRNSRVESEFVSTKLDRDSRHNFNFNTELWEPMSQTCNILLVSLEKALSEWGRGLKVSLYRDFIIHKLGGEEKVIQDVPVFTPSGLIGNQKTHILSEGIAFAISAVTSDQNTIRDHQLRFLDHTQLKAIQWINLNRETINLETIKKS